MKMRISSTDRQKQSPVAAESATMKPPRPEAVEADAATGNRVPDAEPMSRSGLFLRLGAWVRTGLGLLDDVPAWDLSSAGWTKRTMLRAEGKPLQNSAAMGAKDPARQNAPRLLRLIRNWLGRIRNWGQQHLSPGRHRRQLEDKLGRVEDKLGRVEEKLDGVQADVGGLKAVQVQTQADVNRLDGKVDGLDGKVDGLDGKVDGLITQSDQMLERAVLDWHYDDTGLKNQWQRHMHGHPAESNPRYRPQLIERSLYWSDMQPAEIWPSIRDSLLLSPALSSDGLTCDFLIRCRYRLSDHSTADFLIVSEASLSLDSHDFARIRRWRETLRRNQRADLPAPMPVVPILFSQSPAVNPPPDILCLHWSESRFRVEPEFGAKLRRLLGWNAQERSQA